MLFTKYRAYIALASAAVFVILGIMPVSEIIPSIEWNVILMIGGTMGTVFFFIESKMPALMADILLEKTSSVKWAIILLSFFAGVISAFMDNVATVLMIAPVALAISKRLKINPTNMLIAISVSSNLQGAATLVGDTTSILLGGYAGMDFLDFFVFHGKPGMFVVVEIGAIISTLVLVWIFRGEKGKITPSQRTKVTDYFPSVMLLLTVVLLIAASFFPNKPELTNGIICVGLFVICIIRELVFKRNFKGALQSVKEIDYKTLLLLVGLFIIIGGITKAGVIDAIASILVKICGNNLFLSYTVIVWFSVVFSAFIDNIPYVATMLPVVAGMSSIMNIEPYILYFGLLVGATLGGNLTPIGASANITAIGILEKDGYTVTPGQFLKIGFPFTMAAVISGYILIWLIWA
jgi:Na+/H+ antiporter NhaD/arsenite permease-like protein